MKTDLSFNPKVATARTLKMERVWVKGVLRLAFRDSRGLWRDYSTGDVLFNPAAALPSLLPEL